MPSRARAVRILRRAQSDLLEIQRYLDREAPTHGPRMVRVLLDAIERLGRFPHRGPEPRDDRLRSAGYRYLSVRDYLVFYKVLPRQIRVYRVLHGKRAYDHLL